MTYRNEGLVPLIPQLPSALAILLEEYHQEKDDYLALHRLCGILEFTALFLAAVLLAELWQRRHQSGGDFPEPVRRQLLGSFISPTLGKWLEFLSQANAALLALEGSQSLFLPEFPAYVQEFMEAGPDYDTFRDMLAKGEAYALELELPRLPFPQDSREPLIRKKSTLLVCPQGSRSFFFSQWAALEGYDGTVIHKKSAQPDKQSQSWKPGDSHFGSLSREGGERITFWGLGHLLDEEEEKVRLARGGPMRSTDSARRRPPNYPNEDPWYDNREGETPGSILAAPREGTYLTGDELEAHLKDTDTWIEMGEISREVDLIFEKINLNR